MDHNRPRIIIFLFVLIAIIFVDILLVIYRRQSPPAPTSPDLTSTWKTYENKEYGFSLEYPGQYGLKSDTTNNLTNIVSSDYRDDSYDSEPGAAYQYASAMFGISVEDRACTPPSVDTSNPSSAKTTIVSTKDVATGVVYGFQSYPDNYSLFQARMFNNKCLVISCLSSTKGCLENEVSEEFNQILSTLQFADPASTWKTYENKKYGFSLQYPSTWTVEESTNSSPSVSFNPHIDSPHLAGPIEPKAVPYELTIDKTNDNFDKWKQRNNFLPDIKFSVLKINNLNLYITRDLPDMFGNYDVFVDYPDGSGLLRFTLFPVEDDQELDNKIISTFNQILSTFKFLDTPDLTSTWKTYENKELGISLKYPSSWYPEGNFLMHETCKANTSCLTLSFSLTPKSLQQLTSEIAINDGAVDNTDTKPTPVMVNNLSGFELVYGDAMGLGNRKIYLSRLNQNLLIEHIIHESNLKSQINQILATLVFNPLDSTSTWKTYENKEYNFTFKYPATLKLEQNYNSQDHKNYYVSLSNYSEDQTQILHVSENYIKIEFITEDLSSVSNISEFANDPNIFLRHVKDQHLSGNDPTSAQSQVIGGHNCWYIKGSDTSVHCFDSVHKREFIISRGIPTIASLSVFDQILSTLKFL